MNLSLLASGWRKKSSCTLARRGWARECRWKFPCTTQFLIFAPHPSLLSSYSLWSPRLYDSFLLLWTHMFLRVFSGWLPPPDTASLQKYPQTHRLSSGICRWRSRYSQWRYGFPAWKLGTDIKCSGPLYSWSTKSRRNALFNTKSDRKKVHRTHERGNSTLSVDIITPYTHFRQV